MRPAPELGRQARGLGCPGTHDVKGAFGSGQGSAKTS